MTGNRDGNDPHLTASTDRRLVAADWYDHRGFDAVTVRAARAWYAQFLPDRGTILDVGCGRGEFLDVAAAAGMETHGVDQDAAMLAQAMAHHVIEAEALDHMQATPDVYNVVSALHVIEHFDVEDGAALVRLSGDRLMPGGVLIVATPNPGSLPTIAHEFWSDPTHVRPYDVDLLEFLCRRAGLEVQASGVNPTSARGLPVDLDDLELTDGVSKAGDSQAAEGALTRWLGGRIAQTRYAEDMESAVHGVNKELRHTRDELRRVAAILRRALEVVYEPSEIYVVARRQ